MLIEFKSFFCLLKFKLAGGICGANVKIGRVTYKGGAKNIRIGANTIIDDDVFFRDLGGIDIGEGVRVEGGVIFLSASHDVSDDSWRIKSSPIFVGDNVLIGFGSIILPGVRIESNSVILPGSIVRKNFDFKRGGL